MSAVRLALPLAFVLALAGCALPRRGGEGAPKSVADLAWLAGSWQTSEDGLTIEEYWTKPSANAMLGMGRTLRDGRTIFFEYLRIETRADGIYYVAHPKGSPGTEFKLTSIDAAQVTFENPEHDFPKRIRYHRGADGSVTARTDAGGAPSAELPQEFKYRRLPN